MLKNKKTLLLLAVIIIAAAVFAAVMLTRDGKEASAPSADSSETPPLEQTFYIYDTVVNIRLNGDKAAQEHMDHIGQILETIDRQISRTEADGEVYAVNQAAGKKAVAVSEDTLEIVKLSVKYAEDMDGLFDPSIGPLVDLWKIGEGGERVPDQADIDAAVKLTNYKDIVIDEANKTVMLKREGMVLDLGGIGKGYAADKIAEYLKSEGIDSAMINLGGSSIIGLGTKPGGVKWNIGLQDPDKSRGTQLGTIQIADEVIDASGVYERFFMQDGVRYHHILDPHTGFPAQNGLKSITIMSPNATDADALSTGVFLMGLEKGMKYIESLDNVEAFFITEDNKIYATPGIRERLNLTDPEYDFAD
ncbi:FAD:protein FMN transferase [Paenibacillus sp. CN-4]|uniref:FAD:protein FMN transferase n=1 Tax=Paenibacillus nanchangensis TaxID=3348343 RepID=UPI00397D9C9B